MVAPKVMVTEDDVDLRGVLLRGLREEGFDAVGAATGGELLERFPAEGPDVLIVDIGLPDADGRDVCQALRSHGIAAPVLFLTARDALPDRLSGFHAGGDDYLTKPFALAELLVRIRALLKRASEAAPPPDEGRGLRLDPAAHAVRREDRVESLTPTEFRLLAALTARPGDVVRRRELVNSAWPEGAIVHDNTLDAYIGRLRRKLRALGADETIVTARGVGYSLR